MTEYDGVMTKQRGAMLADLAVVPDVVRAPTTLKLNLADMEDLEGRVGRIQRVVLHYRGAEHEFSPDEVLAALYEQRARMEAGA